MKPCSRNRKLIAWLALDALDARRAVALRDHLARCAGCRRYWEDVSAAAEELASAAPDSLLEASECFHHQVAEKLQAVEPGSVLENLWLRGTMLNWRVALPAIAVVVIALFAMVAPRHPPAPSLPGPATVQVVSGSSSGTDLAPTIANYQMTAKRSLESLSELLTTQGNKSLPPAPIYTASSLQLGNAWF
jgi:xanthine dehydrogenase iron-sulfur cluster and FAD-binding subunit A